MTRKRNQATDITVAIATRDRPDMVDRCLHHLLLQSMLPGEIVVVDQSEGTETTMVVKRFEGGPVPIVYEHQSARGLGTSQNRAMTLAKGKIVAITDDDCVADPNWIAAIEVAFNAESGADFVAGPVLPYGPEGSDALPVSTRTALKRRTFDHRAMPWEIGSGNNFAVRREWIAKVDGNDERLGPGSPGQGGVDMDLFYRLAQAGARIRYEPEVLVYHERVTRKGRLDRRVPYGYGMGACCALWLRQHDRNAVRVLRNWTFLRARRLLSGLAEGDFLRVREELLVFAGTAKGLIHGWRLRDQRPSRDWSLHPEHGHREGR